jgi:hypothetical protein
MAAAPTALILSVIGLSRGQDRGAAVVGLCISLLLVLVFFALPLVFLCLS